ncbi:hypothetical protein K8I85_07160, partial [bacterium]|nr:hypothetical protein [bacterium]
FWTGAPSGWGFTGVLTVSDASNGCPGTEFGSHPVLPVNGAVADTWTGIPAGPVVLTYEFGPADPDEWPPPPSRVSIPTDHPAAGPTGPQACGYCYPSTRPIHTFHFGTSDSPLCPGSPLNDGVCDAEALYWSAQFSCAISVEPTSWGSLKNLYR